MSSFCASFLRFIEEGGVVELRLLGVCEDCPISMMTLKEGIERSLTALRAVFRASGRCRRFEAPGGLTGRILRGGRGVRPPDRRHPGRGAPFFCGSSSRTRISSTSDPVARVSTS